MDEIEIGLEPDTMFIVECTSPRGTTWVECPDPESAYLARWQLPRDHAIMGTRIKITNVISGKVVFST